jgi:hypothetical protein
VSKLLLADPTPTVSPTGLPNYFEIEIRLFQVEVNLASRSGIISPSFPLVSRPIPVIIREDESEIAAR